MPNIFSITEYFYLQEEQQAVQVVEGLADGRAGDAPLVDGGEPERQYSTVHCNHCIIAQHSTVQYSTVQYSTVQYSTVWPYLSAISATLALVDSIICASSRQIRHHCTVQELHTGNM